MRDRPKLGLKRPRSTQIVHKKLHLDNGAQLDLYSNKFLLLKFNLAQILCFTSAWPKFNARM